VRSDAKASTAGSTKRQAKGLGAILSLALIVAASCLVLGAGSALAVVPTISSTSVSAVTTKTAVLEAEINPGGEATTYHFEYGTADCSANPCTSAPVPNANVGSGSSPIEVTDEITGLSPGTTYHFRVLATNASGTSEGPDATFTTFAPLTPNTNCPNQVFRIGPSANLPDCRAYEMVSPVDKNGGDGWSPFEPVDQSSPDGNKLAYTSLSPFGESEGSHFLNQYIATRGADGWSTENVTTLGHADLGAKNLFSHYFTFSPDLSSAWLESRGVPLAPGAPDSGVSFNRRDNVNGGYEILHPGISMPSETSELRFGGASDDLSHQVFASNAALTPDAAPGGSFQTYDFSDGALHLVSVLPDGTASSENSISGQTFGFGYLIGSMKHSVSVDGSRVFWTARGVFDDAPVSPAGSVYVRENPAQPESAAKDGEGNCIPEPERACTIQLAPGEETRFYAATPDGSEVLLEIDNVLSRVDVATQAAAPIASIPPVTFDGFNGKTGVIGASEDLSRVYFVSEEDLAPGATAGQRNLYLDQEGTKTFVVSLPLEASRMDPGAVEPRLHSSEISPDGRHLAFASSSAALAQAVAGYDNTDAITGQPDLEVYVYEVGGELICVSCNPSGARPVGGKVSLELGGGENIAAYLPTATASKAPLHVAHALSDSGARVFFDSFDALVPQDTNGVMDVYEWEAPGSGDCEEGASAYSPLNHGCLSLISTGENPSGSGFIAASADGSGVFFHTRSSIDPRDPGSVDLYVAREGGGFPLPPPPPSCEGDACQSIPAAPNDPTPASAVFRGAGDPASVRNCSPAARRAAKLARQASRLSRAAKRSSTPGRSRLLHKRSARLAKRAEQLSKSASRCRRANRGVGR
jgi:hypothetical protein